MINKRKWSKMIISFIVTFASAIISKPVFAIGTEAVFYDDVLNSVYNIFLTIVVVVLCFGILIYIYIKNTNRKIREIIGDELYTKLFKFRKAENDFGKAINESGQGTVVYLKISNIDFLKELYGTKSVEDYVAKIGEKLIAELPPGFIFGRIAISDFLIYSTDEKDETIAKEEVLDIFKSMKEAVTLNEMRINSNFNMGVARMSGGRSIRREILRRASLAMWYSKRQGVNRYKFYSTEIDEKFIKEEEILKELNRALANDEFELYYQPIINSDNGSIYGIEALIRWNHPEKGVLKPNYFLQEAEKNEMIIDIGYWVIDRAFRDYNTILNRFDPEDVENLRLSINVSPNQFRDKYLVENLKNYIIKYNMNPENVVLEITEQIYIQETLRVNELLRNIKKLGCKIAFDDFGVEYSTLSKLQDLNFDVVKIDRQFILGVPDDRVSVEIIKMLSSLTNLTNKKLIAEGVDNEEQLSYLNEYGCNTIQGYYYSKALHIEQLLTDIYNRNVKNDLKIMTTGTNRTDEKENSPLTDETLSKYRQYEALFLNLNEPVSINRLFEDKYTNNDDIMLSAVNDSFVETFFVQGESLVGRKKAAVYPSINGIQMNEISKGVREGKTIRFPQFYHERTNTTYDLSVVSLHNDKFAMIFHATSENSSNLNKLKIAGRNLEEVKYILDLSLSIGNIDVWEYDISSMKIRMLWNDVVGIKKNYMNDYTLDQYIDWVHEEDQGKFRREFMNCIRRAQGKKYEAGVKYSIDYRFKAPHRSEWDWVRSKVQVVDYEGDNPFTVAAVNLDITERKKHEETIRHQITHDTLTGLLNREGLKAALPVKIDSSPKCAVIFMDLDNFKVINDKSGHEKGNLALIEITDKLIAAIPAGSISARLSGDEFLVAFEYKSMYELRSAAEKILKGIAAPLEDGSIVTASMGIALFPEHSTKISQLMKYADQAMYKAKESGKNLYIIHK